MDKIPAQQKRTHRLTTVLSKKMELTTAGTGMPLAMLVFRSMVMVVPRAYGASGTQRTGQIGGHHVVGHAFRAKYHFNTMFIENFHGSGAHAPTDDYFHTLFSEKIGKETWTMSGVRDLLYAKYRRTVRIV